MQAGQTQPTLELVVSNVSDVALGVRTYELRMPDGQDLPGFFAGDHIDVFTPSGIVRQYSLCNNPAETNRYLIAVKLEDLSRGGSASMHSALKLSSRLTVGIPRSNFRLVPADSYVLFAGGIGITPLLSMMHQLEADGADTKVFYFVRSKEHGAFIDELTSAWKHVRIKICYGMSAQEVNDFLGDVCKSIDKNSHAYICGPQVFMERVKDVVSSVIGNEHVHLEYFQASSSSNQVDARPFTVRLARTGQEIEVAANESILEALIKHGIRAANSCQQGVCGSCVVKVLSGIPEHRDNFLSEFHRKANKKIALCVSRSKTDLIELDL